MKSTYLTYNDGRKNKNHTASPSYINVYSEGPHFSPSFQHQIAEMNETTLELSERLSKLGAKAMCEVLKEVLNGTETRVSQKEEDATYVSKIKKEMAKINFNLNAFAVHKLICGLSHWPTAYCYLNGKILKVFKSRLREDFFGKPGEILSKKELIVGFKKDALEFVEVQLEGRKKMFAKNFLNGFKLNVGDFLE